MCNGIFRVQSSIPEKVDLYFESTAGKLQIIKDGTAVDYSEEKATEILSQEKVTATADLKAGKAEATAWGCDLTHGYIDINADTEVKENLKK